MQQEQSVMSGAVQTALLMHEFKNHYQSGREKLGLRYLRAAIETAEDQKARVGVFLRLTKRLERHIATHHRGHAA